MTEILPDIPRFVTALAEWLSCVLYISLLPKRPGRFLLGVQLLAGLGAMLGLHQLAGTWPQPFWVLGMLAAFATMFTLIALTTRIGLRDSGYVAARAFVLAELLASLEWQLRTFYFRTRAEIWSPAASVLWLSTYAVGLGIALLLERRHFSRERPPDIGPRTLAVAGSIAAITFALSNLSFVTKQTPFSGTLPAEVFYIRTLVDLCGYIALYAQHEQLRKQRADVELAALNYVVAAQHQQYLQSKNAIDTANRTWHDLKHHVAAIRAELDPARRTAYLDDLEACVTAHSATYETGNPVLDTILTAKAQYCLASQITFTCMADGAALGRIHPMDLATILGNALDNAIENVQLLADPQQRVVRVTISRVGTFVAMQFDNYFDGTLHYEGDQLRTRKTDAGRHGLGLKSIRHTAKKYGGEVMVTNADNWFKLTVLLPGTATGPATSPAAPSPTDCE